MKYLADSAAVKREIDSYVTHFSGAPLLIGFDQNSDYMNTLALLPNFRQQRLQRGPGDRADPGVVPHRDPKVDARCKGCLGGTRGQHGQCEICFAFRI